MKSNKIGIITFHNANNYGAVLQNFALQKSIRNEGFEPYTIDYHTPVIENGYKLWPKLPKSLPFVNKMSISILRLLNLHKSMRRIKNFNDFRYKYLTMTKPFTKETIQDFDDSDYRTIICGSDQIWNEDLIRDETEIYTLKIFKNCRKASYGASVGAMTIENDSIIGGIRKLDRVTVREQSISSYLNKIGISNLIVCDPVFLLSKKEWKELIVKRKTNKKYVFVYYLDSQKDVVDIASYIAKNNNYSICHPGMMFIKNKSLASFKYEHGPQEFVNDLYYCDMAVISSFHGVVFSIIFEKEFFVVLGKDRGIRIVDLLSLLGLEDRIIENLEEYIQKKDTVQKIDYVDVKKRMSTYISESKVVLRELCN